jgi:hypothetical protein
LLDSFSDATACTAPQRLRVYRTIAQVCDRQTCVSTSRPPYFPLSSCDAPQPGLTRLYPPLCMLSNRWQMHSHCMQAWTTSSSMCPVLPLVPLAKHEPSRHRKPHKAVSTTLELHVMINRITRISASTPVSAIVLPDSNSVYEEPNSADSMTTFDKALSCHDHFNDLG